MLFIVTAKIRRVLAGFVTKSVVGCNFRNAQCTILRKRSAKAITQCTIKDKRAKEQKIFKILLWNKVYVFQTQLICHRSYRAGRRPSASAYAAISKIIALQAIFCAYVLSV